MNFLLTLLCAVVIAWTVMGLAAVVSARVSMDMLGEDGDTRPHKILTAILMLVLAGLLMLFAWSACD